MESKNNTLDYEIDLSKITEIIKKNLILFLAILFVSAATAFGGTKILVPKQYSASATVVIVSSDENTQGITYNDVQVSQKLTSTYSRIMTSETVGDKVIRNLGLKDKGFTTDTFKSSVKVDVNANSEVLDVKATTGDPQLSADIANETVKVFSNEVYNIMNVRNVTVLDSARVPERPSGPNLKKNTLLGFTGGLLLCGLIIFIKYLRDTKVKTEDEVKKILGYPILGNIPDYDSEQKGAVYGR